MKRILPIVLVLAMLMFVLVSCGNKNEETATATAETATVEKTTKAAEKKSTTSKHIEMGIEDKNEGWSFWKEF